MRSATRIILSVVCLLWSVGGCTAPRSSRYVHAPHSNLALGGSAADSYIAEQFSGRSRWPAVNAGRILAEQWYFDEIHRDDQIHHDDDGGATFWSQTSVRSGVYIR